MPEPVPSLPIRVLSRINAFFEYVFGLIAILLLLAVVSAIPVIHFFSLGYLLESSARIARTGKIREGFIGLRPAARIGKFLVAAWLLFLPIRLLYSYWGDANIIDSGSGIASGLRVFLVFTIACAVFVLAWALLRGGKLRHFLWIAPLRWFRWMGQPKSWQPVKERILELKRSTQLLDYFKLGFLGFLGGALWLATPVLILFGAAHIPNQGLSFLTSLFGGLVLAFVTLYLPFLQTRFAVNRRFSEFANWKGARQSFRKAPLALWIALFVTLLFALPLYILKIELAPAEVAWVANLVFVIFMFPARLLLGWAMSRSFRREQNRHWIFRIMGRLGMIPAALVYALVVWIAQYLSWHGSYSLLEQHAFLLPAPMLGM